MGQCWHDYAVDARDGDELAPSSRQYLLCYVYMYELHAVVYGRVQGVMYRDFAQRKARRLRLVGYVRNLADGSVEVVAQGTREALEAYAEKLRRGPLLAHVERVEVSWHEPTQAHPDFSIRW